MAAALPSLAEARDGKGWELVVGAGRPVGRVEGVYADAAEGGPVWLVVAVGRRRRRRIGFARRGVRAIVVPLRECAAMPSRAWTAQDSEAIRNAPTVDPSRPLLREHEATICDHYGIGERMGRHAEVAARAAGTITARPAA
jgi:hypothetical protein